MTKAQEAVRKANETLDMYLELKANFERLPRVSNAGFIAELIHILEDPNMIGLDVEGFVSLRNKYNEYVSYNKAVKHMTEAKRAWYKLNALATEAIIAEYNETNSSQNVNGQPLKIMPDNDMDKTFVGFSEEKMEDCG